MSVLIQDLDFYQVPIEDFIYQWNRGREVGVYNSYNLYLEENYDVMFKNHKTKRYMTLHVDLSGWYEESEIHNVTVDHIDNDIDSSWDADYKNVMSDKMVSDVYIEEN
jgi:hypothetical protein